MRYNSGTTQAHMQMKKIRVLLVKPRGFCAGVARAVEAVDSLLDHVRPHVYALHEIVHNRTLVADFERRGVIFVSSISSIPRGAVAVFSAHGVSPAARREAARRELRVLDCTCPLVAKVHAEARRYQESGYRIVLLGREGHDEVEGVWGEAPGRITLVSTPEQASNLRFEPGDKVAYLVQTTWTPDEARSIVEILRRRAPQIEGPAKNDICYATQNRQNALRAVAREADVVLVAGSANSCNSSNLAAVARAEGSVLPAGRRRVPRFLVVRWCRDGSHHLRRQRSGNGGLGYGRVAPRPLLGHRRGTRDGDGVRLLHRLQRLPEAGRRTAQVGRRKPPRGGCRPSPRNHLAV